MGYVNATPAQVKQNPWNSSTSCSLTQMYIYFLKEDLKRFYELVTLPTLCKGQMPHVLVCSLSSVSVNSLTVTHAGQSREWDVDAAPDACGVGTVSASQSHKFLFSPKSGRYWTFHLEMGKESLMRVGDCAQVMAPGVPHQRGPDPGW